MVEDFRYRERKKIETRQKLIKQEKAEIEAEERQARHIKRTEKYKKRSKDLQI